MLAHLTISNYAIADHLDIDLGPGMTAITGETGAGKSIMLDALGLALGDRADTSVVRPGAKRAEIVASFELEALPAAREWLVARELASGDDECLLRRTVSAEGRSRGYINGQPATLQDLRSLGELLLDLHSQHAHQALLRPARQGRLLDEFAGAAQLADQMQTEARAWQQGSQRLEELGQRSKARRARAQLLRYQIEELDALDPGDDEVEVLERELKQRSSGEQDLRATQTALALCREGELNVVSILGQALRELEGIEIKSEALRQAAEMLDSALINADEASAELQRHLDGFELDPARQAQIEERLDAIHSIARKHRIQAAGLPELAAGLRAELESLEDDDEALDSLRLELQQRREGCDKLAAQLGKKRRQGAKQLVAKVKEQLGELGMGDCRFDIRFENRDSTEPHPSGAERIEFMIATAPDAPLQPLAKIASGGELSRISLAIAVAGARASMPPTIVFDEVDVGIGGATAEVVGELLHRLGRHSQVLCVTHLGQVASKADRHLLVEKQRQKNSIRTTLSPLDGEQKIEEIARMLGGITITPRSRDHAKEMLGVTPAPRTSKSRELAH